MGRSRRLGAGVEVASWVFLVSIWTEVSAFSNGCIGSVGGGCTRLARNVAVASCPLTSRLPQAAIPSSLPKTSYGGRRSWRHGDDSYPFMGRLLKNKSIVDDVSGNLLRRLSILPLERSAATTPPPTTSSTQTSLSVLPSDPIERFSRDRRIGDNEAVENNWVLPGTTSATSSDNVSTSSGRSAPKGIDKAGTASGSLADRLALEQRLRNMLSGQLHRGTRNQSGQQHPPRGIDHGVQQLNSVIARVEAKLDVESPEAGQIREALKTLRSECDAFLREHASTIGRMEAVSRDDDMRRRAAATEIELGRHKEPSKSPDSKPTDVQALLSPRTGQMVNGFGTERYSRNVAEARHGNEGTAATSGTARHENDRGYRERLRTLSDGLASTQLQLATLKATTDKEKGEAAKARTSLTMQVARLEAQLKRAGEGVARERADMEAVLLNLSNALSGVDVQLTQSAGMTPSRETSRASRRAQEEFRRDQRRVKLLLEKQKHRYDSTSRFVEEEAQRMRRKTEELISLRAALAESESKEAQLKSKVAALGSTVSDLDKQLRKTRTALLKEQELRYKTQAALSTSEKQREEETKSLRSELEATREVATSTRQIYEGTVKHRRDWRKALEQKEQAKKQAIEREDATASALWDEIQKNRKSAERRERELNELKKQIVRISRSLALSEEQRAAETQGLRQKIEELNQEASRLEAQAEDSKSLAARTVTRVSRRAFLNASQASKTLAPQGVLSKLGETINSRFRNATSSAGGAAAPATLEGNGAGVSVNATRDGVNDTPTNPRSFSPKHLTNLVGGIREGIGRRTAAASSFPLSSSPPLSERAVKGVLGSVFTSKEAAKEEGNDGGGAQASAAERAGFACATTASDGNRSSGLLGRFRKPNQGSEISKSPPQSTATPVAAKEPRQDNNVGTGGDETSRERRAVSAKVEGSRGKAVATRMRGLFGGRHEREGGGSGPIGNAPDALEEVGLGG